MINQEAVTKFHGERVILPPRPSATSAPEDVQQRSMQPSG
jgi:hypothetical protein